MLTGRDFVLIASTQWEGVWEADHEIASRLAAAGNRVLYIEHMGFGAPTLRKMPRALSYLPRWLRCRLRGGVRAVAPNLYVCTPLVLPPFGTALARAANRRIFLPMIRAAADQIGIGDPIIITWVPTDTTLDLLEMLRGRESTVVAYWVADYERIVRDRARLRAVETEMLGRADLVLAATASILAWCSRWNSNASLFGHAVNTESFRHAAGDEPPEFAGMARPVIGYIGGLHAAFSFDLIREAAALRPEWSWVFVGSARGVSGSLPALPNVHHVGWRSHEEMPQWLGAFDVCIIPYRVDDSTTEILPTKLLEYLAAGKPVVSTSLPAVEQLRRLHPFFTTTSDDPAEFIGAIGRLLAETPDAALSWRRHTFAASQDWSIRIEQLSDSIISARPRGEDQRRVARARTTSSQ